jgi:hypothetical protein
MPSADTYCPRPEESLPSRVTSKSLRFLRHMRIAIHIRAIRHLDAWDAARLYPPDYCKAIHKGTFAPYEGHVITKFQVGLRKFPGSWLHKSFIASLGLQTGRAPLRPAACRQPARAIRAC